MGKIFLSEEEQHIVAFKLLKSLPYRGRILICIAMLVTGFMFQLFFMQFFIVGCIFLFIGNLFLLVDGYDNRVKFGSFDPGSKWDRVEKEKLTELIEMQKSINKWDTSTTDCSNGLGCFLMILMLAACGGIIYIGHAMLLKPLFILGIDAVILLLPQWVTGLRRASVVIDTGLSRKIEVIQRVIADCSNELKEHEIEYYMLLSGKDNTRIPKDIKFKVDLKGHHPDFLGLYGQVVMNNVQGNLYPYFYTVLVAKEGYGLQIVKGNVVGFKKVKGGGFLSRLINSASLTKSLKHQKDVEVLVIRQTTTKKSGYFTDKQAAGNILLTGLKSAEVNAYKK